MGASFTNFPPDRRGRPGKKGGKRGWVGEWRALEEGMGGGNFPSEIEMYHIKINKLLLGCEPCLNQNNVSNQMLTVSDSLKLPNTLLNRKWKVLSFQFLTV